jgi:hypothetical protein
MAEEPATRPPERPEGQDDEPPDVRQAVVVAMALIGDFARHVEHGDGDGADLLLRALAVRAVLRRIRDRLGADDGS